MELQITDNPTHRPDRRSASTSGIAIRWRPDRIGETGAGGVANKNSISAPEHTLEWFSAGERLLVSFDTMYRFEAGQRVVFRGYVNPIGGSTSAAGIDTLNSSDTESYSRLMKARGYTGRTYISQFSHPDISYEARKNVKTAITKLQTVATQRLNRLLVTPDEFAIATAMTTGDRTAIAPELREAYSRIGASHLLAVSGLHVGIVFVIVNVLLYLLPFFPRGHIIKNLVAIVAIWCYAALTGLSPSATRAAFMFTGAQVGFATSRHRSTTNVMCGTAMVMLAVRPGLLFDISFQLSFIAVAAILAWFSPLYRLVRSRFRILNALWATLLVGFVASLATMPLVSHTFGVFSPVGIVLNPLIITTAHLIVIFSLVWIIAPVAALEPLFRWLVGAPAWLQNRVVEASSAVPEAAIEYTLPLWAVFAIYATMIIFTAWLAGRPREEEPFVLPR
jgi:competence protein ComEC